MSGFFVAINVASQLQIKTNNLRQMEATESAMAPGRGENAAAAGSGQSSAGAAASDAENANLLRCSSKTKIFFERHDGICKIFNLVKFSLKLKFCMVLATVAVWEVRVGAI